MDRNDHKMVKTDFIVVICMELIAFKHAQNRSFDWFEKYSSYFELENFVGLKLPK